MWKENPVREKNAYRKVILHMLFNTILLPNWSRWIYKSGTFTSVIMVLDQVSYILCVHMYEVPAYELLHYKTIVSL